MLCFTPFAVRIPSRVVVFKSKGKSTSEASDNRAVQLWAQGDRFTLHSCRNERVGGVWGRESSEGCGMVTGAPVVQAIARIMPPSPTLEEVTWRVCRVPATPQGTGLPDPVPFTAPTQGEVSPGPQSSTWEVTWSGEQGVTDWNRVPLDGSIPPK